MRLATRQQQWNLDTLLFSKMAGDKFPEESCLQAEAPTTEATGDSRLALTALLDGFLYQCTD